MRISHWLREAVHPLVRGCFIRVHFATTGECYLLFMVQYATILPIYLNILPIYLRVMQVCFRVFLCMGVPVMCVRALLGSFAAFFVFGSPTGLM